MAAIIRQIRHALRLIPRNKGFSAAVLLSTALGIGATASIFSLVDAFLLRPLPVPATGRVARLTSVNQSNPVGRLSYAEIEEIDHRTQSFEGLATSKNAAFGFSQGRDQHPRVTAGVLVNGDYFSTLRVTPALGRLLTAADDRVAGRSAVVVLSYGMWQREFGGRPDVIGRSLRLNASEFVIVGVARPSGSRASIRSFNRPSTCRA
jgi:putative ABC transport system permease protein